MDGYQENSVNLWLLEVELGKMEKRRCGGCRA